VEPGSFTSDSQIFTSDVSGILSATDLQFSYTSLGGAVSEWFFNTISTLRQTAPVYLSVIDQASSDTVYGTFLVNDVSYDNVTFQLYYLPVSLVTGAGYFIVGNTYVVSVLPAGPTGPIGPTGETGPIGETGPQGIPGIAENTGATGDSMALVRSNCMHQ
jgi:hypothetical protein